MDKAKVIEGLKICVSATNPNSDWACEQCPYFAEHDCSGELMSEALRLIEEG